MKNRLEELRKARGIKQEELASALEVSRQTIGSLENGRYETRPSCWRSKSRGILGLPSRIFSSTKRRETHEGKTALYHLHRDRGRADGGQPAAHGRLLRQHGVLGGVRHGLRRERAAVQILLVAGPRTQRRLRAKRQEAHINAVDERKQMLRMRAGYLVNQLMFWILLGLDFVLALLKAPAWIILILFVLWIFQYIVGIVIYRHLEKRL